MVKLQLCIIQDFLIKAFSYALPHLDENIAYQNEDALDHYMKVEVEAHQKISSINLADLFHIFLQPIFYLILEELHNASHLISSFYGHEFNLLFPFLQESNHRSQSLYLTLRYKLYQNDSLALLVIYLPHVLLIFLFLSMGCQPILKIYLSYSTLIIHVLQISLLYFLIQSMFLNYSN